MNHTLYDFVRELTIPGWIAVIGGVMLIAFLVLSSLIFLIFKLSKSRNKD